MSKFGRTGNTGYMAHGLLTGSFSFTSSITYLVRSLLARWEWAWPPLQNYFTHNSPILLDLVKNVAVVDNAQKGTTIKQLTYILCEDSRAAILKTFSWE